MRFDATKDAVERLYSLALALVNDYERFETLVDAGGEVGGRGEVVKEWRKRWYRWSKRRWSTRQRPRRRLVKRDAGSCGQAPVAAGGRRGAVRGGGEIRRVLRGADPEVGHAELWAPPRSTVPKAQPREDRANWTRGDRKARVGQTAERHTAEQFAGSRRSRRSDRVVEGASVGCWRASLNRQGAFDETSAG